MWKALHSCRVGLPLALPLLALLLAPPWARAETLTVSGMANIFGAGHAVPPDPDGGGGGLLPPFVTFAPGPGRVLTFSSVTGMVSCCGSDPAAFNGPDGGSMASGTTDITSFGGISGILHGRGDLTTAPPTLPFVAGKTMFLVGVFLDATEPMDPAPPRLEFTMPPFGLGEDFAVLAPLLRQTFFIGDGLTGTGSGVSQQFLVPATATRLFLGFEDALQFGFPTDPPGFYFDNFGSLEATFSLAATAAVPEPASLALFGLGALALLGYSFRPRK